MNIEYKILRRKEINNLIRRRRMDSDHCGHMLFHGTNYQSLTASDIEIKKMFEICNYIKDIIIKYLTINSGNPKIQQEIGKPNSTLKNVSFKEYGDMCVTNNLYNAILYCTNDFGEQGKVIGSILDLAKKLNIKLDDDRLNKYLFYYKNHIYRYHQAQKVIIIFQNIGYMDMKVDEDGNSIEMSKIKPLNDQLMIDTLKLEENSDQTVVGLVVLEKDFDLLIDVVGNNKEKKLLKDKYQL